MGIPSIPQCLGRLASANFITSANVNLSSSSYTITGGNLDTANVSFSVNYTLNVVLNGSSAFTISDSVAVTIDANLGLNATVTKAIGPLSGNFFVTGSATLVDSNGGADYRAPAGELRLCFKSLEGVTVVTVGCELSYYSALI